MRLDLKDIILMDGGVVPFDYELDLSQLEFNGAYPIAEPVKAVGEVRNTAGVLELTATLTTNLHLICDRCATPFEREKTVEVDNLVADHLDNKPTMETDDILLLDGNELDLDNALTSALILDMDTKVLCREDCKGLCSGCGVNLNFEKCRCKKEVDPRLAVLAQLLETENTEDKEDKEEDSDK